MWYEIKKNNNRLSFTGGVVGGGENQFLSNPTTVELSLVELRFLLIASTLL